MTRKEAIDRLRKISEKTPIRTNGDDLLAITMAIKALSQEPTTTSTDEPMTMVYPTIVCDDAISREAVIMECIKYADHEHNVRVKKEVSEGRKHDAQVIIYACDYFKTFVEKLPSVTQKSGKWIETTDRLPEDKTYVLTTIKVPNRVAHARSGWYQGGFFHNDNGDTWNSTDREVIAWMPLPTPYEPQESEDKE